MYWKEKHSNTFKSCQIHRIYELNATTKSLLRMGNSKFSLSPEFPSRGRVSESWGRVSEKNASDAMDAAKD